MAKHCVWMLFSIHHPLLCVQNCKHLSSQCLWIIFLFDQVIWKVLKLIIRDKNYLWWSYQSHDNPHACQKTNFFFTKNMNALHVNVWMSLFQNQSMTFVIVGHIIVEKNVHRQKMLHQYLLMIPIYDMLNNIYVYRDYETRIGVGNKPFH
jgi:hypothetical protein